MRGEGVRRRLTRAGNRLGVWLYRSLGGRLSGGRTGAAVLMITVPGRRTGLPRSTCVQCLDTPEGLLVWGTASGSSRDPDWFRNLRACEVAEVQLGRERFPVRPRELLDAERDAVWRDTILARLPKVERYARRAGRTIPVALLVPVGGRQPA
jgi:deazaflavin-dependent oxidoreductase (nitroreductase family)